MFDLNSKVGSFLFSVQRRSGCSQAINWVKKYEEKTFREMMSDFSTNKTVKQSWVSFSLTLYFNQFDIEIRKLLIKKITDPMKAFLLYLKLKDLTDGEDRLLEEKFKGKLPQAEKELKQRIVKREKG